jgi:hypothetical protein
MVERRSLKASNLGRFDGFPSNEQGALDPLIFEGKSLAAAQHAKFVWNESASS